MEKMLLSQLQASYLHHSLLFNIASSGDPGVFFPKLGAISEEEREDPKEEREKQQGAEEGQQRKRKGSVCSSEWSRDSSRTGSEEREAEEEPIINVTSFDQLDELDQLRAHCQDECAAANSRRSGQHSAAPRPPTESPPISTPSSNISQPSSPSAVPPDGDGTEEERAGGTEAMQQRYLAQLSPSASIAAEVQRVSIEDRAVKKSSPESARIERTGRALRKHAAVEDEEHPLLLERPSPSFGRLSPLPQPLPQQLHSLSSAEQHFAATLAAAASQVIRPAVGTAADRAQQPFGRVQPLPAQPPAQHQFDPITLQQLALLQQQMAGHQTAASVPAVKHEQLNREELLSSLVQQPGMLAALGGNWLGQQQQQQTVQHALASLSALMQQQQQQQQQASPNPLVAEFRESALVAEPAASSSGSRLASIQEEQQHPTVDVSRLFEAVGRNHSTESTASTSGTSAAPSAASVVVASGADSIPRKQDIQTDIRMNRGRFQLVRKRGRSEVWNLFGQVVDTLTGARLPYVACYACKVLYTDTGGGTGNMTRHRCSVGSSYRSVRRSSSDTTVGNDSISINQSSSFESVGGAGPVPGQHGGSSLSGALSPQEEHKEVKALWAGQQISSAGAAREAFAQSASSGFLSGSTTSVSSAPTSLDSHHYQQLHLNLGPPPMLMMSRFAASTAAVPPPAHPSGGGSLLAPFGPSSLSQPSQSLSVSPSLLQHSPSVPSTRTPHSLLAGLGQGHHFTPADKQLFAAAVIQYCAQDMHSYRVVEGEGFKNLVETVLFIGRRSHGDPSANTYDPVRNLIPTAKQLKQTFERQEHVVRQATLRDLALVRDMGIAFSCQSLQFGGDRHLGISANYITEDWRITRRTLRVAKVDGSDGQLCALVADVLQEFQLDTAKLVLLTTDGGTGAGGQCHQLPNNVLLVPNANCALNSILAQSLGECPDSAHISAFIRLCYRLVAAVRSVDRVGQFPMAELLLSDANADIKAMDFTSDVYLVVKFVKEHAIEIAALLECEGMLELALELRQINWQASTELELFLEPFHETAQMFVDSRQPHFQRILPEWFALMHECQPQHSLDEPSALEEAQEQQQPPQHHSPPTPAPHTPSWLRSVRVEANRRLREWADANICVEHRVATVLNPRLRQLPVICSDAERAAVYDRVRELVGLQKPRREAEREAEMRAMKNEPFKKRRRFLDRLEDCAMEEEDELDAYLRSSFTSAQTRDILDFWSSVGESQFPRLARLARFVLATSGAPAPIPVQPPSTSTLAPNDIGTLLNLRPEVLNSLSQHPRPQPAIPHPIPSASSME